MEFTIDKESFLRVLSQVHNVVQPKNALPILGNVQIEAKDKKLFLSTTDLDMGISTSIGAQVKKEGKTTLPVRSLTSIIRELPQSDVNIKIDKNNIAEIVSGASYFKLLGLPADEFPKFLVIESEDVINISGEILDEALSLTSYAMSKDPMRYVLNGMLFSFEGDELTLVATDGKRLATYEIEVAPEIAERLAEKSIIVPSKTINELQRLISKNDVEMRVDDDKIGFKFGATEIKSKIIDHAFPNFRKAIPEESENKIIFKREVLQSALRRVSLLSFNEINTVRLCLKKDQLEINSNNPELGAAKESIDISYAGKDFDVIYNSAFLIDPLKHIKDDEVFFEIFNGKEQCVIQTNSPFKYILMPLTLE